jgi:hypothetical protein
VCKRETLYARVTTVALALLVTDNMGQLSKLSSVGAENVDPTPSKDNVSPEVQSPTAKHQVASVPHTTNHSPTVPTNIQEYSVDS